MLSAHYIRRPFDPSDRYVLGLACNFAGRLQTPEDMATVGIVDTSDDLGDSFHRADGTPLKLPLTVNPVPGYQADINVHMSRQWFDLWVSLLREAGYQEP
jgi:hypothetical protein